MQVNIKNLIDDAQCYQTVRELRWPNGIECPSCESKQVIKRGCDDTEPARQRYECHDCSKRFDDLTGSVLKMEMAILHCPSKGISVDKQANDDVVHLYRFREADGLTDQAFNACPQGQMLALDLLGISFAWAVPVKVQMGRTYVLGEGWSCT